MKILFLSMAFLCLTAHYCKSQNRRWMYMATSDDKSIWFVDTISTDIKQDDNIKYGASNAVTFWVMIYQKTIRNKKPSIFKLIEKIKADTVKNRYQSSTSVRYRDGKVIDSDSSTWEWEDVIPGTMAEYYIKFAKSVNNKRLHYYFIGESFLNSGNYPKLKSNE